VRIDLFVDDEREPRGSFDAPGTFELDTIGLEDGPHTLIVRAREPDGTPGLERISFTVRNGPGIAIFGIREGETLRGRVPILVNAYASRIGDEFEPVRAETPSPIPTWAWVLSLAVAAWAFYYAMAEYRQHAAQLAAAAPTIARSTESAAPAAPEPVAQWSRQALGEQVFGNYCAACHQLTGEGVPAVFPPLRGDPVVTAVDPAEHIRVILEGLSGKPIGGVTYASAMPPLGAALSDEQIAAVANHERTAWGNAAPTVTAADVSAVRAVATPASP
jgi:mono/diheme cytochrome c family protein